jgi:hypothetical protein
MPLLWIHRALASDIFVPMSNMSDAYYFTKELLLKNGTDLSIIGYPAENLDEFYTTGTADIGQISNMQVSFISDKYIPEEGWEYWNNSGYIMSTKEEALALGTSFEPEGFIPGESSIPWKKETRTHAELDAELDNYMKNGKEIEPGILNRLYSLLLGSA